MGGLGEIAESGGDRRMEFFKRWRREIMLNGNKRAVNLLRKRLAAIRDGQTAYQNTERKK